MKKLFFPVLRQDHRLADGLFSPNRRGLVFTLFIAFFASVLWSCGTMHVYKEPDQPVFQSREQTPQTIAQGDSLNVVTFNIKKAEKIALATTELAQLQKAKNIDVYLLQEMDEPGVKAIANSLGLNYLYIPVVYRTAEKKDVGNAILTSGTIDWTEKLLLPHAKPLSKSRRLVTIAELTVHKEKVLVYSVHTETSVMSRKNRMDQVDAILAHARTQWPGHRYVLIGGDFNTLFTKSSKQAVERFRADGYDWSTAAVGTTARAFFGLVKPRLDYIFSKGLEPMRAYKIEDSKSSDHYPVVATFRYQSSGKLASTD